ncbi:hypothetical protein OG819_44590 [Streptomyces sp. NBC_01549]|uniref:hypothetical protein n=1 Tax=Streptomyces sp. NBC_01549 TaxID=2975874 RepID=UPI0022598C32|nr:hypothetical protein [Streptomyces sp. NBC_01549]MCX4596480.1 hypothetical protein [Streptomyces sp. NBC_01549]
MQAVASVVLASTDVDRKTNEITRFAPLLDQISDLRGTVITSPTSPNAAPTGC